MGTPVATYAAKGGPPVDHVKDTRPDPSDPTGKKQIWNGHYIDRTKAGKYTLHYEGSHVTSSWPMSKIPFGAPLKVDPKHKTDVLWQDAHKAWHSVRKTLGLGASVDVPAEVIVANDQLTKRVGGSSTKGVLPAHWPFNDFGHAVWYLINEKTGAKSEQFLHETPENERQRELKLPVVLEYSHGCVHVDPSAIDDMAAKKYLVNGTRFVVHNYSEVPPKVTPSGPTKTGSKYVLHFFPGSHQIIVYSNP